MSDLQPLPGFDWSKVRWGGPRDPVAEECSYCGAPLGEDSVPLRLFSPKGAACAFCDACMRTWWGLESFGDEVSDP